MLGTPYRPSSLIPRRNRALLPCLIAAAALCQAVASRNAHAQVFREADAGLTGVVDGSSSLGDTDNDGNLDLVITGSIHGGEETAALYLGNAHGVFRQVDAELGNEGGQSALGDVNNDGNLDLVITGGSDDYETATLYLGDGEGGFSKANAGLKGVAFSSAEMGDVNNDGNLDLIITGHDRSKPTTTLYLGDGTGAFRELNTGLTGVYRGSTSVGDINNDGNLDLVITGEDGDGNDTSKLYLGDGTGQFRQVDAGLTGVEMGATAIGDVNKDGNLDLVISGIYDRWLLNSTTTATLYLGDGTGSFNRANAGLTGVYRGSASLGDIDDDDNLDLVMTGANRQRERMSKLYLGDGAGGFREADAGLPGVMHSSSTLGDVDADDDLDLVITGGNARNNISTMTTLYENVSCEE